MSEVAIRPAQHPVAEPACTICIANFNGRGVIEECLASVFAQDAEGAIEVIVHDDASTDGSADWLRDGFPQLELLVAERNAGFCVANNRMVARARGNYVLLLNNDAVLAPDAIRTLLAATRDGHADDILTLPQFDHASGILVDRGCRLDPFCNPVPNLDATRAAVAMAIGACLWVPRRLWKELGGFPEWFGSIGEDLYLCALARLRGHRVVALDQSGYRHRQGHSFGGNRTTADRLDTTLRRRRLSERNKTMALLVSTPTALVWPLLALHLALLALEGSVLALARRDGAIFTRIYAPAIAAPWRERARWWPARRAAQRARRVPVRDYFSAFTPLPRKLVMLLRHGLPTIRH